MPFEKPAGTRSQRPGPRTARPRTGHQKTAGRAPERVNGTAQQKHAQWLSRAADAERSGDPVEAELCRQYAEHWYRVLRGHE